MNRLVSCCGVLIWRGPRRAASGPREFANPHHRADHDTLIERMWRARIRARGCPSPQLRLLPAIPAFLEPQSPAPPRLRVV